MKPIMLKSLFTYLLISSCFAAGTALSACKKWVVCVDCYSSGNQYPDEFRRRGYCVYHVATRKKPHPLLAATFRPDDFDGVICIEDVGRRAVERKVASLKPHAIFPGTETGVILANELARDQGLPFNGGEHISALIDKYEFYLLLKEKNLPVIPSLLSGDPSGQEMLGWMQEQGFRFPMVLKPQRGAATEGFSKISRISEYPAAFRKIMDAPDFHGDRSKAVFIQPFRRKKERAHQIVVGQKGAFLYEHDIFEISKRSQLGSRIYDTATLLRNVQMTNAKLSPARTNIAQVARALEMQVGTIHAEVFENGEIVDWAARPPGGGIPAIVKALTGRDFIAKSVDSYLNNTQFQNRAISDPPITDHIVVVSLIAFPGREGSFVSYNLDRFLNDPLVVSHLSKLSLKPKQILRPTIDMKSPGHLTLRGDPKQIRQFVSELREFERSGKAYSLSPLCSSASFQLKTRKKT